MSEAAAKKPDFRARVAEEMIRQIEAGTAPWMKPWQPGTIRTAPYNPTTGNAYRGMNALWLPQPALKFQPVEEAEKVLAQGGVEIRHDQSDRAFYRMGSDRIHLPPMGAFKEGYEYYATALHELGHATGHPSRLARDMSGGFGSPSYAKEELRAEIASYMVTTELGLGHYPERHANYVESWLKALADDRNEIFRAARDADRMASWMLEPEKRPELERAAQAAQKAEQQEEQSEQKEQAMEPAEKRPRVFLAMLDNGTMAALLTEARAADATVILIGDDRQLSSVDHRDGKVCKGPRERHHQRGHGNCQRH